MHTGYAPIGTRAPSWVNMLLCKHGRHCKRGKESNEKTTTTCISAATRDRIRDLQIFSLTLSQLSYRGATAQSYPTSQHSSQAHTQPITHPTHASAGRQPLFASWIPTTTFKVQLNDHLATNKTQPACRNIYRHCAVWTPCVKSSRGGIRFDSTSRTVP